MRRGGCEEGRHGGGEAARRPGERLPTEQHPTQGQEHETRLIAGILAQTHMNSLSHFTIPFINVIMAAYKFSILLSFFLPISPFNFSTFLLF